MLRLKLTKPLYSLWVTEGVLWQGVDENIFIQEE
jgi:hypothetical protein